MVQEAFKAVTRGQCIYAIKAARKEHNQEDELLLARERESVRIHADSPSEANYVSLLETRLSVSLHFTNLAHTESRQRGKSIFVEGDKNGKLLANLVADQKAPVSIPVIKNAGGVLVTEPDDILNEFVHYFSSLYSPIPSYDSQDLDELLQGLSLPRLSNSDIALLDDSISILEIEAAILARRLRVQMDFWQTSTKYT